MKISLQFLFLLSIFFVSHCKIDDCEEMLCFSPPPVLWFELVDANTGENLFTNGTYFKDQIKIQKVGDGTNVNFNFITENELNLIGIHSIGWQTEIVNFSVGVSTNNIFKLHVDAKRVNENCCSFTRFDEIKIENSNYEFDPKSGIYKILVVL